MLGSGGECRDWGEHLAGGRDGGTQCSFVELMTALRISKAESWRGISMVCPAMNRVG